MMTSLISITWELDRACHCKAVEVAQWSRCLLDKHEDLPRIPTHVKKLGVVSSVIYNLNTEHSWKQSQGLSNQQSGLNGEIQVQW